MPQGEQTIEVGYRDRTVLVRVNGRGILMNCMFLKRHLDEMIDQGYNKLIIDGLNCDYMDSSFLGTLTGIAIRLRKQYNTQVEIVNMCEHVKETMTTIGLNHIFILNEQKDLSSFPITTVLPMGGADPEVLKRDMLEAHRSLVEADEGNRERFKHVFDAAGNPIPAPEPLDRRKSREDRRHEQVETDEERRKRKGDRRENGGAG